ncbi:MAG: molybdopterin-dependent oxidoreductase [Acidobacteriaceae bacterium]|nr:molybdopterin-dependent oxidoreductase [Acidobacteriaceae bacterium]
MKRHLSIVVISLVLSSAPTQCQQITIQTVGGKQTALARADIESLPHVKVAAHGSEMSATFEGAPLKAVLEKAGVEFGHSLRGKRMASCLLVEAADGYRVVIALPEIDPDFTDKEVVLAYLQDGKPLDEKAGPYRIVIPDEKRMARWVRQVTTLKIVDVQ